MKRILLLVLTNFAVMAVLLITTRLLGVPGWWPDNEDPAFYADAGVFRPVRRVPQSAQ